MAYIIGLVSPEEAAILRKRGWKLEKPPDEFIEGLESGIPKGRPDRMRMVYVDNDMFDIMSGADWDTSQISLPIKRRI